MSDIKRLSKREGLPVGEWVRRTHRDACASRPAIEPEAKLKSVRRAVTYSFPATDIEQMLSKLE